MKKGRGVWGVLLSLNYPYQKMVINIFEILDSMLSYMVRKMKYQKCRGVFIIVLKMSKNVFLKIMVTNILKIFIVMVLSVTK
jgi:hypothetical protein